MQLDQYLRRVGLELPLPPAADTLRRLHVAHLAAFTFNNVEIQRGGSIAVDLSSIERKFLTGIGGGYCFEHNTLFAAVLRELGFEVTTVLAHVGPSEMRALTHLILHVRIDGARWLADVGFGGQGILEPLVLEDGARVDQRGATYSLRRGEHFWILTFECGGDREEMYEFGDAPHTRGDVEVANHFTATHPASIFRRSITIQRVTADERTILRPKVVVRYRNGVRSEVPVEPGQLRRIARELFAIDLGDAPLVFEETRTT
jgi:N-hydroxyarylamine O-acetyltransferase